MQISPLTETEQPAQAGDPAILSAMADALRLVIVDDDACMRGALCAFLATMDGVTVIGEALNGLDAIELVQDRKPDLVLMDVRMPQMDGVEAAHILKHLWPQTKIILLSIHAGYQAEAQAAGADAFLVKGCCVQELAGAIRSVGRR